MSLLMRIRSLAILAAVVVGFVIVVDRGEAGGVKGKVDPLPSWKVGPTKKGILEFVARVTDKKSPDYMAPADRIATFDNDGTLWCEMPLVEMAFTRDRVKEMAAKDAKFKEMQPFKAALEGDRDFFHKAGTKAIMELVAATHGDMSRDRFMEEAATFFKSAKHPKFGVPYQKATYVPMIELQKYLRANGFQTWICTGGWMDFVRVISKDAYGIPESRVIGSSLKMKFVEKDGKKIVWILPLLGAFCDQDDKPVEIALHIGKRPLFSAGNVRSGGDIAHLTYCQGRKGPSFQLMINHDDAKREYAYAEPKGESLKAARDNGWHVVSMRDDWLKIFAFEK